VLHGAKVHLKTPRSVKGTIEAVQGKEIHHINDIDNPVIGIVRRAIQGASEVSQQDQEVAYIPHAISIVVRMASGCPSAKIHAEGVSKVLPF
jgi:hypothetical protein